MSRERPPVGRRTVLKGIGATAAGTATLAGSATAESTNLVGIGRTLRVYPQLSSLPGFYETIQDALDDASSGDTVRVFPFADLEESVTVETPDVTIRGSRFIRPTVQAPPGAATTVTIDANGVSLTGLEIRNPDGSGDGPTSLNAVGVHVEPDNTGVRIENNDINTIGTGANTNVIGVFVERDTDGITVRGNRLASLDGTDDDEDRTQAILLIGQEGGTVGSIDNASVIRNAIFDVADTRSAKGIEFNGDISGEIRGNAIAELNTDGPSETGFTQAIALGQGANATTGPSEVLIENNTVSDLETGTVDDFAPATHVIFSPGTDVATVDLRNNDFTADSDEELYVLDRADGDFDPDLSSLVAGNTLDVDNDVYDERDGSFFNA